MDNFQPNNFAASPNALSNSKKQTMGKICGKVLQFNRSFYLYFVPSKPVHYFGCRKKFNSKCFYFKYFSVFYQFKVCFLTLSPDHEIRSSNFCLFERLL